jgi:8-oxo-dGTP pyrophosphatase MutT (NUDIX family)
MKKHGCGALILSHLCINHEEYDWGKALFNSERTVLLLQRGFSAPTFPGCWGAPGGLREENESEAEAAVRETMEEIGIEFLPFEFPFFRDTWEDRNLSYFFGRWRMPPRLLISEESIGYGWFTLPEALKLSLSFCYREALQLEWPP